MKIKMLITQFGSQNGLTAEKFDKDKEYDIVDKLAKVFIREKWAVEVVEEKAKVEEKKIAVPENKAMFSSPENKVESYKSYKRTK